MDIVYLASKSSNNNIELRYSLRSLSNIEHGKVFIVGYKPKWCKNIEHIPFDDKEHKYINVRKKHRIISEIEGLSDDFVYMNDDFYFIDKQKVENYHIGTIGEQLKYIKRRDCGKNSVYQTGLEQLREIFGENAMSFEAHTPMTMNKTKLNNLLNKYTDYPTTALRTLYGNEYKLKSKWLKAPNYKGYIEKCIDCKCYELETLEIIKGQKLLSSENAIAGTAQFNDFMKSIFKEISEYEIPDTFTLLESRDIRYPIIMEGRSDAKIHRFGKQFVSNGEGMLEASNKEEAILFAHYGFNYYYENNQ